MRFYRRWAWGGSLATGGPWRRGSRSACSNGWTTRHAWMPRSAPGFSRTSREGLACRIDDAESRGVTERGAKELVNTRAITCGSKWRRSPGNSARRSDGSETPTWPRTATSVATRKRPSGSGGTTPTSEGVRVRSSTSRAGSSRGRMEELSMSIGELGEHRHGEPRGDPGGPLGTEDPPGRATLLRDRAGAGRLGLRLRDVEGRLLGFVDQDSTPSLPFRAGALPGSGAPRSPNAGRRRVGSARRGLLRFERPGRLRGGSKA